MTEPRATTRRPVDAVAALLTDGTVITVRPITPDDAPRLVEFHRGLTPATVRLRFFTFHPELQPSEVTYFTTVDHTDREALLALFGDTIIGVARYDRLADTRSAEVAFVIDDRWQGRGAATLLLEHLTARAREEGIEEFVADTLTENRRMLDVFRASGQHLRMTFDGTVLHLAFSIQPTTKAGTAVDRREHISEAHSIARLLRPRSVAVVGASEREGSIGRALVDNIVAGGFTGRVVPIHPTATTIRGLPAYPSVGAVPDDVDLALVAVPASSVIEVASDCGRKGVHGLVVISSGFAEMAGDGQDHQRELVRVARGHGMRIIGPNCLGIVNTDPAISLHATFGATTPRPGRVGMMSQSGAVGIVILEAAHASGLGISSFVSAGNKADVSGNDLLQYWEDDPDTDVVLLYLESFGNPRKFARLARRVSATKPIVAVKSGRTAAGRRAASSHTAAMAADDDAVEALFRQAGVIRVDTVREMFGVARVLASQPLPEGRRVAIVGNSGGPGILAADACATARLALPDLTPATVSALADLLPAGAALSNPVDMLAGSGATTYAAALATVIADPRVDAVIAVFTPTSVARHDDVVAAIDAVAAAGGKPVLAALLAAPPVHASTEAGAGALPCFESAEEAVLALGRVADYADWRRRPPGAHALFADVSIERARAVIQRDLPADGRWLSSAESGELAGIYGLPIVSSVPAPDVEAAVVAASRFGVPIALKAEGLVHKTDAGGVALGLDSEPAVRAAWDEMQRRLGASFRGAVVQPMVAAGVETIAGVVSDTTFGPLILFGLGGTLTELLGDRVLRLVPVTDLDAAEMVRGLRTSPLLFGYRGAAPVDIASLEELLLRLSFLAENHPEIAEIDLNPVVASASGAVIVDAKVRVAPPPVQNAARHLRPA